MQDIDKIYKKVKPTKNLFILYPKKYPAIEKSTAKTAYKLIILFILLPFPKKASIIFNPYHSLKPTLKFLTKAIFPVIYVIENIINNPKPTIIAQ